MQHKFYPNNYECWLYNNWDNKCWDWPPDSSAGFPSGGHPSPSTASACPQSRTPFRSLPTTPWSLVSTSPSQQRICSTRPGPKGIGSPSSKGSSANTARESSLNDIYNNQILLNGSKGFINRNYFNFAFLSSSPSWSLRSRTHSSGTYVIFLPASSSSMMWVVGSFSTSSFVRILFWYYSARKRNRVENVFRLEMNWRG